MDIKPPKKRRLNNDIARPPRQIPQTPQNNQAQTKARPQTGAKDGFLRYKNLKKLFSKRQANDISTDEIKHILRDNKIFILHTVLVFAAVFFLYLFRLPNLPKPSGLDSVTALNVQSFSDLSSNIVFGPQKFLDYILLKLNLANTLELRLASVVFSVIAVIVFFLLIKRWIGVKVSVLATLIFASSTWVIAQTRNADFINGYFLVIPLLLLIGSFVIRKPKTVWIFPLIFGLACLSYLPGFIWFLVFSAVIYFKKIKKLANACGTKKSIVLGLTYLLPIIPLVFFLIKNPPSFSLWLGLPAGFEFEMSAMLSNIVDLPSQLFASGVDNRLIWLSGSPIINAATAFLAFIGLIFLATDKPHPMRRISLIGLFLLCLGLIAVGGAVYISLLIPLIYIFTGLGIFYLLDQWFSIFPRNPVARSIGYILMSGLVLGISFYHVSRYYIVWPRNDQVIQAFDSAASDTIDTRANNKFYIK